MKQILFTIFLISTFVANAQNELNAYKYIIVPKKFEAFKNYNEYLTSTLIKHLFTEKGFMTVYADELPEDLKQNRCSGLKVDLLDNSALFSTKTEILLKDCSEKEIFRSVLGTSREKNYKTAFAEAIRQSFKSFDKINYVYKAPIEDAAPITVSFKNDVKQLVKENKNESNETKTVVFQEATQENQSFKSMEPATSTFQKVGQMNSPGNSSKTERILYAQQTANGFQLVDSTPKIQYRLYTSSNPDVYWAVAETQKGIVFQKEGIWYFEYFENEQTAIQELVIKF